MCASHVPHSGTVPGEREWGHKGRRRFWCLMLLTGSGCKHRPQSRRPPPAVHSTGSASAAPVSYSIWNLPEMRIPGPHSRPAELERERAEPEMHKPSGDLRNTGIQLFYLRSWLALFFVWFCFYFFKIEIKVNKIFEFSFSITLSTNSTPFPEIILHVCTFTSR